MKALTLWQPWAWAIAEGLKPVENRTWPPPKWVVGTRIAIHAGVKFDLEVRGRGMPAGVACPAPGDVTMSAIVATAVIDRVIDSEQASSLAREHGRLGGMAYATEEDFDEMLESPWFFGPFGWVLADVRRVNPAVPCKGAQGLWTLSPEVEQLVLARERISTKERNVS